MRNDQPIQGFDEGWTAICAMSVFAPVNMLSLRHQDGREATWFLDHKFRHIGGGLAQANDVSDAALTSGARRLFHQVIARVNDAEPAMDPRERPEDDLVPLCDSTIFELLDLTWDDLFGHVTVVDLDDPKAIPALDAVSLSRPDLMSSLGGSLPEAYRQRLTTGRLTRPSPFGTGPVEAEIGLLIQDRLTAYRFTDPHRACVFYLLTQGYHDATCALYIPSLGLYCTTGVAPGFRHFSYLFLLHAVRHVRKLEAYLLRPAAGRQTVTFVSDYPTLHLGHVVWNELSGLQELVGTVGRRNLPQVYVLNAAAGSEPFGPLDRIVPEFKGRIVRSPVKWLDAAAHVYENNLFFMRYMTRYVPATIGRRILAHALRDPRLAGEGDLARRLREDGRTCILLGLRVGNRTIPDFEVFLADVVDHLLKRLGQITIVVEGHNARLGNDPSTSFSSFGPASQEEPLIDELRIVFALRRRYRKNHDVEIVSTVGAPIACSLFWIAQCRFFVAPWGASLAKYRWICNKPGFVVTNRSNIAEPVGDLLIYNHPSFMEDPTLMIFIAAEHVRDVPGQHGFYANFIPSADAVAAGIDVMIDHTAR